MKELHEISLIAAVAQNGVIGHNGTLPWHLKKDFSWFVQQTTGKTIVMGRKNYEDIIGFTKGKPLKDRKNIVLSRKPVNNIDLLPGFVFYNDIQTLLFQHPEKLMIIGGTQIYQEFLPMATELILTEIHQEFEGNTHFPQWNKNLFKETFRQNEKEGDINFDFVIYKKIPC